MVPKRITPLTAIFLVFKVFQGHSLPRKKYSLIPHLPMIEVDDGGSERWIEVELSCGIKEMKIKRKNQVQA